MTVREEVRGHALWLTIDREERRNALDPEVMDGLTAGLARAQGEEDVRVVVVTGAGEKAFCAGGDIGGFASEDGPTPAERIGRLLGSIREHPQPVVARVNGRALGGGFGLMLACDLVVAADDVEVGTPEVNIGLWPHVITAVIQREVPRKVALEMMLTGRRVSAREAERWGMINNVVPRVGLDAAVDDLAAELASKSPAVLRLGKRSFRGAEDLASFDEALAYLGERLGEHLALEDLAEGVAAFLEKREPRWRGR
jgi:enoyl-CoA hydratase/carnithine racemase